MFIMPHAELERTRRLVGSAAVPSQKSDEEPFDLEIPKRGSVAGMFYYAGSSASQVRGFYLRIGLEVAAVAAAVTLTKIVWVVLAAPVFLWIERYVLRRQAFKRAEAFERDYTALLLSLASGIRTGLDPLVALLDSEKLFSEKSELRRQVLKLKDGIERGYPEETVLKHFAGSINHPDLKLFRTAFVLARREGSSLAECLQRLAKVTRQRQSFRRKVRGAVAMQKLSSFGIAACTIVIGVMQAMTNPEAFKLAIHHPLGLKLLVAGLGLVAGGITWMLSMTRARL